MSGSLFSGFSVSMYNDANLLSLMRLAGGLKTCELDDFAGEITTSHFAETGDHEL